MPGTIPLAHDFNCPWCWIGLFHARRLQEEFGVEIDWRGYELYPEDSPWPDAPRREPDHPARPQIPGRLELAFAAAEMQPALERFPAKMRTHKAHEAVEYAKGEGAADALVERFYRAAWESGRDLDDPAVLADCAKGVIGDVGEMLAAVRDRRFADAIVGFDAPAYARGVFHVPTFFIGRERLAEQTYAAIRAAMERAGCAAHPASDLYSALDFPAGPDDRPYVFVNMVATIDGKTVTGERDEPVGDLGSEIDHAAMRRIEKAADAVMIGAGSLRSTPGVWYPHHKTRVVLTRSGRLNFGVRFFQDAPHMAVVAAPDGADVAAPKPIAVWRGGDELDLERLLSWLKRERGVHRLVAEGGSELNAALLAQDLVDELFLTVAPKVKLGSNTPTYAGGTPLARNELRRFQIVSHRRIGDELFVRYRRVQGK